MVTEDFCRLLQRFGASCLRPEGHRANNSKPEQNMSNTNTIKIAARYSNLADAVEATKMDLSYNERDARQTIKRMTNDKQLKVVQVFSDDCNNVWYIINVVAENLNIVHRFEPFFSCLSDSPFKVFVPTKNGEAVDFSDADSLKQIGLAKKETKSRRVIANAGMIAG